MASLKKNNRSKRDYINKKGTSNKNDASIFGVNESENLTDKNTENLTSASAYNVDVTENSTLLTKENLSNRVDSQNFAIDLENKGQENVKSVKNLDGKDNSKFEVKGSHKSANDGEKLTNDGDTSKNDNLSNDSDNLDNGSDNSKNRKDKSANSILGNGSDSLNDTGKDNISNIYSIYNNTTIYKEGLRNDEFGKSDESEEVKPITAKPKVKYKKSFVQRIKALVILVFLGIFTGSGLGVWYFNSIMGSMVDYSQFDESEYIVSPHEVIDGIEERFGFTVSNDQFFFTEAEARGITPADLTPVENFILAEYKATFASSFHIVGNGNVRALGLVSQPVYSEKNFDGNHYTFESLSRGTVTVGRCAIMKRGGQNVRFYSSWNEAVHEDYADWSDYVDYKNEGYIALSGSTPDGVQSYIVSGKTIISQNDSSVIKYDQASGNYTFSFDLDPLTSVIRYAKQVQQTSGLDSAPAFRSVSQTVTIDEDWNFVTISVEEVYSVFFGISVTCNGSLTSNFVFDDITQVDFPSGVDFSNIG